MVRSSTRISHQGKKNYNEEGAETADLASSNELKVKKRKVAHDDDEEPKTSCGKSKAKRRRFSKGRLQAFLHLPLDLVYEIFGYLEPFDLLQLARTSKQLRSLLMSRTSAFVWKTSRSNIPGLPECPDDLSEPQYAHLMFFTGCHVCGRKINGIRIIWNARIRVCKSCNGKIFEQQTHFWKYEYTSTPFAELLPFLPNGNAPGYVSSRFSALEKEWKTQYHNASDKVQWVRNMVEKRRAIDEHAKACEIWQDELLRKKEEKQTSIIDGRKSLVFEYIKQLGWEDELLKMSHWEHVVGNQVDVVRVCQKPVTEDALASLNGFIQRFMEETRRERLVRERDAMYKKRLLILNDIIRAYAATIAPTAPFPTSADVFKHPMVRSIIETTPPTDNFTPEVLQPIVPLLPQIDLHWQEKARSQLFMMIRTAAPWYVFDEQTVLDLATTSFHCKRAGYQGCSYGGHIGHPDILMHECARSDPFSRENDFNPGSAEFYIRQFLHEVPWNYRRELDFDPVQMRILTDVVRMCGLDPTTTTRAEMDDLDSIFECVQCNDERHGRATMRWWGVPIHYRNHRGHSSRGEMQVIMLNERDAAKARLGMLEQEQKRLSEYSFHLASSLVCNRCGAQGNFPSTMRHVHSAHGIPDPTMDDCRYSHRPHYYPQDIFWLWPPRLISQQLSVVVMPSEGSSGPQDSMEEDSLETTTGSQSSDE